MPKRNIALSRVAGDALTVLATQIRAARHGKGWTAEDLGARIGVSARTVTAIENGSPGAAIGSVLNAAAVTGVPLFTEDVGDLARLRRQGREAVALIPKRTRTAGSDHDDDELDF